MYTRSSRYDDIYRQSHTVAARVDVLALDGSIQYSTSDGSLRVDDGNVSASSAAIRRTGDFQMRGDLDHMLRWWLRDDNTRFQLWRGIRYPDGSTELGSLGYFCATEVDLDDSGVSKLHRLTLADESYLVSERSLTTAVSLNGNIAEIVKLLISGALPSIRFASVEDDFNANATVAYNVKADPWQSALDLLASSGGEAYMDVAGLCKIRKIPQLDKSYPIWVFRDGANCDYMNIQSTLLRKRSNHVIATSETPQAGTPFRSDVYDLDPTSSSYYLGRYGDVPFFLEGVAVNSQAQLDVAANAAFQKVKGKADTQTVSLLPHVFFEIDDVVFFQRQNTEQSGYYIIDKLAIPLSYARPMYITMRRGRGADAGATNLNNIGAPVPPGGGGTGLPATGGYLLTEAGNRIIANSGNPIVWS